ncbi:MAG TPA: hypothetical protein VM425_19765 [Myxococcota bacterium]|nr:hypothetical protein [Myxococcota bacterium]
MGAPADESDFLRFDCDRVILWVQRRIIQEMKDPNRLKFNFGIFGWALVTLSQ